MLKPLFDNVVLEKEKQELKTASGIVLQESSKDQPSVGKIIAVGPGKIVEGSLVVPSVKVGQRVVFKKYGGTEVEINKTEYLIIAEDDILAVVE
ncbi:10 kDa chaperonin [bioreactor metagenome]|uniref:10 kDa chaperonin n=1 Tax=bioreactor metagenome TaxID=1076179 RepID=A0A645D7K0_9ZZZZ